MTETLAGGNIVKCAHCGGTGMCVRSTIVHPRKNDHTTHLARCQLCGDGLEVSTGERHSPPPVCALCGGKGVVRV